MNIKTLEYRSNGFGDYKKIQPNVYLFECPVCEYKHEKETNFISHEIKYCECCLHLLKQRENALRNLPCYMQPVKYSEEEKDMWNHTKWLRIAIGKGE